MTYLTDLEPVKEDGQFGGWEDGPVTLDGQNYERRATASTDTPSCETVREYALSRGFSHFRAVLGLADNTVNTASTSVRITGDGKTIRSETVQLGRSIKVNLDVSGLVRLGLEAESPGCDDVTVAFGDPRLES